MDSKARLCQKTGFGCRTKTVCMPTILCLVAVLKKNFWYTIPSLKTWWAKLSLISDLGQWAANGYKKLQGKITPVTTVGLLGVRWNTATNIISLSTRQLPANNTFITKRHFIDLISDHWPIRVGDSSDSESQNIAPKDLEVQSYKGRASIRYNHRQVDSNTY